MVPDIHEIILPNDSLRLIYSYLEWKDFLNCCSVKNQWNSVANDLPFLKEQIFWKQTFNPKHWRDHFAELIGPNKVENIDLDDEALKESYGSFPNCIGKLFKSECPIFPGKKWGETHDIIWIPAKVNVWKIIFLLLDKGFLNRKSIISSKLDLSVSEKPNWIAITKCPVAKGGGYQTIINQQNKIDGLGSGYHFPSVIEAIVWIYIRVLKQKHFVHNIICQENTIKSYEVLEFFKYRDRTGISISRPFLDYRIYNYIASRQL